MRFSKRDANGLSFVEFCFRIHYSRFKIFVIKWTEVYWKKLLEFKSSYHFICSFLNNTLLIFLIVPFIIENKQVSVKAENIKTLQKLFFLKDSRVSIVEFPSSLSLIAECCQLKLQQTMSKQSASTWILLRGVSIHVMSRFFNMPRLPFISSGQGNDSVFPSPTNLSVLC